MMEKLKKMYKELNAAALTNLNNNWSIEKKILYYKDIIWNIPFREIHHTVETVCEFVKPIYPNIDPLKYFEYFFSKINFLKIEKNTNKTETLKYCYAIYYGLERILKVDISKAILTYQNNISKLSKEQIQKTQIKLIKLIGNLKRQVRTNEPGISFTKHYIALSKEIKNNKEELQTIDYQILISHFRESMVNDLLSSFETIIETFKELTPLLKVSPPQQSEKQKPELNRQPIIFKDNETIEKLHAELKGYFQGKKAELMKVLQGEQLSEKLFFPHQQNKFVEVFKRLKYNGFLLSTPKEIENWICSNFSYQYRKGNKKEVRNFNASTVHDILTKERCEPPKKERICTPDWLKYKSYSIRQRESGKENF